MRIKFKKDHLVYKAETEVDGHPNAAYLVTLGVAEKVEGKQVKEKSEMTGTGTEKKEIKKPGKVK